MHAQVRYFAGDQKVEDVLDVELDGTKEGYHDEFLWHGLHDVPRNIVLIFLLEVWLC